MVNANPMVNGSLMANATTRARVVLAAIVRQDADPMTVPAMALPRDLK
jgi:hypothetical protein